MVCNHYLFPVYDQENGHGTHLLSSAPLMPMYRAARLRKGLSAELPERRWHCSALSSAPNRQGDMEKPFPKPQLTRRPAQAFTSSVLQLLKSDLAAQTPVSFKDRNEERMTVLIRTRLMPW